jgi:hypothetical protein
MQYLISVIDDTVGMATPAEMAAIDVFNDRLRAQGHWVFAGGLGGTDAETKEHVAGFWIIEAADLDVAIELAAGGSKACNRKVEVRPFL